MSRSALLSVALSSLAVLAFTKSSSCPVEDNPSWKFVKRLPRPRSKMAGAEVNGKLYLLGGSETRGSGTRLAKDVLEYDTKSNTFDVAVSDVSSEFWFEKGQGFARDSRIYVMGAFSESAHWSPISVNVSDWQFRHESDLECPKSLFAASNPNYAGIDDYCVAYDESRDLLFIAGGFVWIQGSTSSGWKRTNATLFYSFTKNTWTRVADLKSARYDHSCTIVDGFLYAVGGKHKNEYITSVERLCVSDECLQQEEAHASGWQTVAGVVLSPPRAGTKAVAVQCPYDNGCKHTDELTLITGGYNTLADNSAIKYVSKFDAHDSTDNVSISDGPCMRLRKSDHLLIRSKKKDGMVFSFGGSFSNGSYISQVERLKVTRVFGEKTYWSRAKNKFNHHKHNIIVFSIICTWILGSWISCAIWNCAYGSLFKRKIHGTDETLLAYQTMDGDEDNL